MDLPTCWWLKNLNLADQNPSVAASKLRGERKKFGFLDLAAEIRLQVYEHLLLNCTVDGRLHSVQVVDSLQRRLDGYAPYVRYNEGDGQGLIPAKGSRNSAGNIHAAILQTCRQIAEEGSHFLYCNNVFAVNLSRESYAPKYRFFRENDKHLMQPVANLFRMKDIPCYLSELSYVAFIKQIGPQNTAAIRHMQIYGNNTEEYSLAMPILTEIVKRYLTSLLTAIFFLVANTNDSRSYERQEYERYINRTQPSLTADEDYDTRPLDFSFDPDNPTRATGAFRPLYIALDDFSKKVTSLQWLEYRGHWHFMQQDFLGIGFDCRWAMMITDRIEEYVRYSGLGKRRAAGVLKEIFLDPSTSPSIMRARSAINGRLHRWRDYQEEFALINGRGLRPCGRSLVDDLL